MQHTIYTIGTVVSPYRQKFGIARQPGLVPAAKVCIVLNSEFNADSVRGLIDFDYIWVHFIFHQVLDEQWSQLVRPPRLGGRKKMGVFATRSPHRPNYLGLSLLKLEHIDSENGVKLYCSGTDLLDGTPIVDIKPYLPFVEAKPDAASGFVVGKPPELTVLLSPECAIEDVDTEIVELAKQSIAQDPRPAYQDLPDRVYVMTLADYEVRFQIDGSQAIILAIDLIKS